jgi:phosphatidylserine synthase
VPATVVVAATRTEQPGAGMRIAGLTVVERAIKQLAQPSGAEVVVASDGSVALPPSLPGNVHVQMLDTDAGDDAVASLAGGIGAPVVAADIVRVGRADSGTRIVDEASRSAAEDAVFAALYRADLGFVARRFNKPLSVRLTRHWLVGTSITPNQITLVAAAIGLVGCALIALGGYIATVGGMLCAHVQSVLDGCDGELARVRFQQSKLGAWLDTFVDDVLNVLMTVAIGFGLWRAGTGTWALAGGLAGGAMLVASNLIIMRDMRRQGASGDLMDMVWWFSGGRKLADMPSTAGKASIGSVLFVMGRRDTAIALWLLFALAGVPALILIMAFIIALSWFVAALVQLVVRPVPPASR